MATKYGGIKLRLPKGFSEMLQGFAREVLREQPSDIATFGAEYFRGMLDNRNATGDDPLQNFADREARFQKDRHFGTESEDILRPVDSKVRGAELQKQAAATKIQANYKGYSIRKRRHEENKAAARIQAGYRGHATRKRLKDRTNEPLLTGQVQREPAETVDAEYDEEQQAAAVRIQANFRGHKARQELENKEKERVEDEKENAAAVRIQANYRGYKTRKDMNESGKKNVQFEGDVVETTNEYEVTVSPEEKTEISLEITEDVDEQAEEEKDDVLSDKQETEPSEILHNELHGQEESGYDKTEGQDEPQEEADLDDPDMEKAALKIQAQFRGYKTRKELKAGEQREEAEAERGGEHETEISHQEEEGAHVEDRTEDADDGQEVDDDDTKEKAAATKIQAQYRGYKTRKSLKGEKKEEDDATNEDGAIATDGEEQVVD